MAGAGKGIAVGGGQPSGVQPPQLTNEPQMGFPLRPGDDFINRNRNAPSATPMQLLQQFSGLPQSPQLNTPQSAQTQFSTQPQSPQQPNIFNTASTGVNTAVNAATGETSFQPMMVSAGTGTADIANYVDKINAERVAAGQIAGTDLSAYTNPYESQVVGQSLSDLDRARQMQAMQLNAQATRAGAFGGSRQALMQSELGRNYLDQSARTASGLRQAGFQNAQQLAGQDIASRMQADLANQGASLQAGTTNAQLAQQINLANQAARNNMSQFNIGNQLQAALANQGATLAGSQQRLAAAGQLGNLSNLGFGMGMDIQNQAMQQGALEQGINQMILDRARAQYAGMQGAPAQSLGYMAQALGATPTPMTQTNSKQPGLFDYLTLGASMFRPG